MTAIARAVTQIGGQSILARLIGVKPQAVQQWVNAGVCPAKRAIQVEKATNGAVSRFELRPDLYPTDTDIEAA